LHASMSGGNFKGGKLRRNEVFKVGVKFDIRENIGRGTSLKSVLEQFGS